MSPEEAEGNLDIDTRTDVYPLGVLNRQGGRGSGVVLAVGRVGKGGNPGAWSVVLIAPGYGRGDKAIPSYFNIPRRSRGVWTRFDSRLRFGSRGAGCLMQPTQTRVTLLARLRDPADADAWRQFEATYREMILRFCRSRGLQHADAEDVLQTVLARLVTAIRQLDYDRGKGRFRDYLYRCVRSAISDWAARPKASGWSVVENSGMDPAERGDAEAVWEREWVEHHYRLAMVSVRSSSDVKSVAVFEATLAGRKVAEIAEQMKMSEQAVYKVQQRMRDRMKEAIARQVAEEDGAGG